MSSVEALLELNALPEKAFEFLCYALPEFLDILATIPPHRAVELLPVLLMLDGIFHIAGSFMVRNPNWRWLVLNGVLVLLFGLGLAIWQQFSHLRVWGIALILGITMFVNGTSFLVLGLAGRKPRESSQ